MSSISSTGLRHSERKPDDTYRRVLDYTIELDAGHKFSHEEKEPREDGIASKFIIYYAEDGEAPGGEVTNNTNELGQTEQSPEDDPDSLTVELKDAAGGDPVDSKEIDYKKSVEDSELEEGTP